MWIVVYLITWLVGFQCTELNTDLPRLNGAAIPIRLATIRLPPHVTDTKLVSPPLASLTPNTPSYPPRKRLLGLSRAYLLAYA